jgi:hypothetical protein
LHWATINTSVLLTVTHCLCAALQVTNHAAGEFKEGVLRYTSLHKLLVQQSPRDKFLGLM